MSISHDKLAGDLKKQYPKVPEFFTNQTTIVPAYIINSYGLIGKPINKLLNNNAKLEK